MSCSNRTKSSREIANDYFAWVANFTLVKSLPFHPRHAIYYYCHVSACIAAVFPLILDSNASTEGPDARMGRALENADKYCPRCDVTPESLKSENEKIKNTGT